ncbi:MULTISPECIES: GNAT family N-acetyltransferase [Flavobacterium]|uniref:GNAT family N-acetyltransferase n=1 Tax=Flavobacterium TaxID=237 RepID=UPI00086A0747|nr:MULTISPECIES: GNAT family N-acetyltransferase [Flavobacterium]MBN9283375.1 GNAT family N-acetyltransferase [Flavobacterium sp.]ODS87075.1 MAG: hypothetical protein ABS44_12070 [Chryseobacterium sp. SCN 40-13]OJV69501.1 MAG: hypothetical protein BGO42_14135 [Flavobacterium sp. 40-81]
MDYLLENLETERLLFRKLNPSDFDTWLAFYKDPESSELWNAALSPEEACKQWFEEQFSRYDNKSGGMHVLTDKKTKAFVGQCGLLVLDYNNSTEIALAFSLLPKFQHKGYAEEAALKCKEYAFKTLKAGSLIALISPSDMLSEQVATAIGMEWEDTNIYNDKIVNIFRLKK